MHACTWPTSRLKPSKCEFVRPKVEYLSHIIITSRLKILSAANTAIKQNALYYKMEYLLAAKSVVTHSMWMHHGPTGADFILETIKFQCQLQTFFSKGRFHIKKWNSSEPQIIQHLPAEVMKPTQKLPTSDEYNKTHWIQWNAVKDCTNYLHLSYTTGNLTKCSLVSDVEKNFDALDWFPSTIKAKKSHAASLGAQRLTGMILCLETSIAYGYNGEQSYTRMTISRCYKESDTLPKYTGFLMPLNSPMQP